MLMTLLALAVAAPLHFDCQGPVSQAQSADALLARFGRDARRAAIPGAEGRMTPAVVLYPDDPSRRLEVTFWDKAETAIASVTTGPRAVAWTGPLGLHLGSSMAEVVAANGSNITMAGFGWDYGGYVSNSFSGKLSKQACAVQVRLGLPAGVRGPKSIMGERELTSAMPDVKAAGPVVESLSIGWPLPAGVKAGQP